MATKRGWPNRGDLLTAYEWITEVWRCEQDPILHHLRLVRTSTQVFVKPALTLTRENGGSNGSQR